MVEVIYIAGKVNSGTENLHIFVSSFFYKKFKLNVLLMYRLKAFIKK